MKKLILVAPLAISLIQLGCGGQAKTATVLEDSKTVSVAKDNVIKAKQYHELAAQSKIQQAQLQQFVDGWVQDCKMKGLQLTMGNDGDPGCSTPPPAAPTPAPPAPSTPAKK